MAAVLFLVIDFFSRVRIALLKKEWILHSFYCLVFLLSCTHRACISIVPDYSYNVITISKFDVQHGLKKSAILR